MEGIAEATRSAKPNRVAVAGASFERIASWLEPQQVMQDVELRDRLHALQTAADAIARERGLDAAPISRALWRRELVGSTGIGCAVAIPHARIAHIDRPLTLFMRAKWAIDFDAPDGKPVSNILTILVPTEGNADDHLELLAMVAQLFSDGAFRARLTNASGVADVRAAFVECAKQIAQRSTAH